MPKLIHSDAPEPDRYRSVDIVAGDPPYIFFWTDEVPGKGQGVGVPVAHELMPELHEKLGDWPDGLGGTLGGRRA